MRAETLFAPMIDDEIADHAIEIGARILYHLALETREPQAGLLDDVFRCCVAAEFARGECAQFGVVRLDYLIELRNRQIGHRTSDRRHGHQTATM